jgi:hypothetical protein
LRKKTEPDFYDNPDETYWIPYCLSFLSRYPLYDLLGDYLRGMTCSTPRRSLGF